MQHEIAASLLLRGYDSMQDHCKAAVTATRSAILRPRLPGASSLLPKAFFVCTFDKQQSQLYSQLRKSSQRNAQE
jgi:hypothetical protein